MSVGKSVKRVDALQKVTGEAMYTDDFNTGQTLTAKILHSTIANGRVLSIDTKLAESLPGVEKVVTCFDVPDIVFPTAGHPWSTDPGHQDVMDRKLLNARVRYYGDDVAAVICDNEVTADKALELIKVEYEEYEPVLNALETIKPGAPVIHEERPDNILASSTYSMGDFDEAVKESGLTIVEGQYETQAVQHCHIETPVSYAYWQGDRVTIVSSTQIPHIVRRVVGQALGIRWGRVRVIKPYIGGGFGNKQDALYEPLNAYLSMAVGGRCVKLNISREETFVNTRTRHAMNFKISSAVRADGTLVARKMTVYSNQGAYASHGHAVTANAASCFRQTYQAEKAVSCNAYTVYTNRPCGGAMRGYGIPQISFAVESHMDDIAKKLNLDPIEFRLKNVMQEGFTDPYLGIKSNTNGLRECVQKGMDFIGWKEKREKYKNQTGLIRRGVGMSLFTYKTGVYPISLETAGCRIVLNQDGSVQVQLGATEIGQGADTVFSQMAAETLGLPFDHVFVVSSQDTDVTPFDTGAYASRQSYVSGLALKNAAILLKQEILDYAKKLTGIDPGCLDISEGNIVQTAGGEVVMPLSELAVSAFYNLDDARHLTAEVSNQCKTNTFATGVCFAEVEVDIPLCKVKVLNIINVHDSGRLLNPQLAEAQVHGGMSMGLGYALSELLLYDEKGKPLNGNLLDYKLPTSMDTPELSCDFVELYDPTAPYGNKALGEPPAIPQGGAIRNAVLNATGITFDKIPLSPQNLFEKFKDVLGGESNV